VSKETHLCQKRHIKLALGSIGVFVHVRDMCVCDMAHPYYYMEDMP